MKLIASHALRAAALAFVLPILGVSASVTINGTGPITFGNSNSGSSNQDISVNGDPFNVSSTYSASFNGSGTQITFSPIVTYTGGSNINQTGDTVSVDFIQSFFDGEATDWNGPYTESIPLQVPAHATGVAELYVYSSGNSILQGIGTVGPFGPGNYNVSKTADITGLTGTTLTYDYSFIFTFAPGLTPGSVASSTPEPAQTIPAAIGLAGVALIALRRRNR